MTTVTFKPGAKVRRIERNLESPKAALRQIGALLVAESQASFREQSFNGRDWPARGRVNVFGILRDLAEGRKPPARRLETRPALRDTGRLASSIAFQVQGDNAVEVGTNVPYANAHQTGGTSTAPPLTSSIQKKLAAWIRGKPEYVQRRLGPLTNPKRRGEVLTMELPRRPFLGLTNQSRKDIREVVGVRVLETTRSGG